MTGESLYPRDLIERLRSELDRLEALARPAALHIDEHGWHDGGGMCSEEWDFIDANGPHVVLRTIQAHRKIVERCETALIARDVAVDTPLAGATRMALRLEREHLELVASIYFPESDG